ncbi:hypothetical protein FB567DRAFT_555309 [Paraphoma chrysanthemicola]|uniref:C3H1-type domain-containing protein n=1 Tax=Paraphoma chrysanthemicola TaxID=798071 RepID=A0A8K0QT09_9PLEO|nr:hypothetical protein FB567DRAFT_555309 [Paraphoma chrysanthemicola]
MTTGDDADGKNRHPSAAQVEVIKEFEAATLKCKQLLDDSATKYERLLEKYRALKENVEEPDRSRDYVLVLIDGHSHKLNDMYTRGGVVGGGCAVRAISDEISAHLAKVMPKEERYRLVIKAIGSLNTMTAKYRRNKGEKEDTRWSLERLAEDFSSLQTWTDFILLRLPQEVEDKLIGKSYLTCLFEWHVRDPRCQHVILGVHGSGKYLKSLYALSEYHNKITLLQGSYVDPALEHVGLPIISLSTFVSPASNSKAAVASQSRKDDPKDHSKVPSTRSKKSESKPQPLRAVAGAHGYFKNNRYIQYTKPKNGQEQTSSMRTSKTKPHASSVILPTEARPGLIPINSNGHRLDIYVACPSEAQYKLYHARIRDQKLCSPFHLQGSCTGRVCNFDHSPADPDTVACLRFQVADWPCKEEGECRRADCYYGHVCQKSKCSGGKVATCKFKGSGHNVDCKVAEWIRPGDVVTRKWEEKGLNRGMDNAVGSMENWPTMVGDLIDI